MNEISPMRRVKQLMRKLKIMRIKMSVIQDMEYQRLLKSMEKKYLKLQNKKVIERIGSKRDGSWIVIR
mgnify:FL=1